ncbi:hypothetical protein BDN72DRAFT_827689 [Pluteus cervinus]|uniref:Uncharacterized protein n=1 Tax=Pluteus cervinus TaxID=181527 RepID=A0ACD3A949_9AGAR|nr:hypothetical protein BDN72DRAFT_827689 [Pluteus cervinus]
MDRPPWMSQVASEESDSAEGTVNRPNFLTTILDNAIRGADFTSDDARRYLGLALAPLPSDQRQKVLIDFWHSISGRDLNSAEILDLTILVLEALAENTLTTRLRVPPVLQCVLLFWRCMLPNNAPFTHKAFEFLLQHSDSAVPQDAPGELLLIILLVTQSQDLQHGPHRCHFGMAFSAVFRSLISLASRPSLSRHMTAILAGWAILSARRAPSMPETLSLVDLAHRHVTRTRIRSLIPDHHVVYLLFRARVYALQSHRSQGRVVAAIRAIEEARRYVSDTDVHSIERLCQVFSTIVNVSRSDYHIKFHLLYPFVQWATPLLPVESHLRGRFLAKREFVIDCHLHTLLPFRELDAPDRTVHNMFQCAASLIPPVELNARDIAFIRDQFVQTRSGFVEVPCTQPEEYPAGAVQFMTSVTADLTTQIERSLQGSHRLLHSSFFAALVARAMGVPTAMHLYRYFMSNLHGHIFTMVPLPMRYEVYHRIFGIIPDAISYATELEQYDLALEWNDRGRAVIWGQILHLRFPYLKELRDADPALAKRWVDVTAQMYASLIAPFHNESIKDISKSTIQLQYSMMDIKKLNNPKFNTFFADKTYKDIQSSALALGGPIIFLNVNRYSSSALAVVPTSEHVLHIPLPSIDYKVLTSMQMLFSRYIESGGRGEELTPERIGKLVKTLDSPPLPPRSIVSFPEVLRYLWIQIIEPVLKALKIKPSSPESSDQLPRVWWSPSGPLSSLPVHAAGDYNKDELGNKISDYVVSSYCPSTSIIHYASRPEEGFQNFRMLAVANPEGCRLPGTEGDLEAINTYVPDPQVRVTVLSKTGATIEAVKREIERATWVHFACHAKQNTESPLDSTLILANHARLSLTEIAKLSLPHAEFAFLSACQTAQGTGSNLAGNPNESEHLAAGMLVAGYRSVVGSMWNVSDECAPKVAREVYKRLFENGKPDYRRAAYALHDAVQALRKDGVGFGFWVPFIHLGV